MMEIGTVFLSVAKHFLLWTEFYYSENKHSLIYAANVGTHKKTAESKNRVNQGYFVVLKGSKIG